MECLTVLLSPAACNLERTDILDVKEVGSDDGFDEDDNLASDCFISEEVEWEFHASKRHFSELPRESSTGWAFIAFTSDPDATRFLLDLLTTLSPVI